MNQLAILYHQFNAPPENYKIDMQINALWSPFEFSSKNDISHPLNQVEKCYIIEHMLHYWGEFPGCWNFLYYQGIVEEIDNDARNDMLQLRVFIPIRVHHEHMHAIRTYDARGVQ